MKTGAASIGQAFIAGEKSDPNILNIAVGSPDHSTLVAVK